MEWSEETDQVIPAFVQLQSAMAAVPETGRNQHLRTTYVELPAILAEIRRTAPAVKLAVIQEPERENEHVLRVWTTFLHESGQWARASIVVEITPGKGQSANQAFGAAITYGRRLALCSLLGIVEGSDDDGGHRGGHGPHHHEDRNQPRRDRDRKPKPKNPAEDPHAEARRPLLAQLGEFEGSLIADAKQRLGIKDSLSEAHPSRIETLLELCREGFVELEPEDEAASHG